MAIEETRLANRWAGLNREKLGQVFNREKLSSVVSREKLGSVNVGQTERWASVLGGAALAALALRGGRRSKGVAGLAALAGLPLLLRGATGHCPVYQKMGIDRTEGSTTGKGTALASDRVLTEEPSTETNLNAIPTF
ncbi:MAG TPA: YgaP-like transmembrane domain [Thermoanaerobaculia bacterium]|nr:YgaP-like transmembrane domain [Thermoanaerobaculia bacterium]